MVNELENMELPADIYEAAIDLFDGDREATKRWLTSTAQGLGNARPVDFAHSETGAREVLDLLSRLNYGVLS